MSESNIQQNKPQNNDEIDIFEFCSCIWTAFQNFLIGVKDVIVAIIIFLIRKSLWIISFALLGMIAGYILYGVSQSFYTSALEGNTGGMYDPEEKEYAGGVDNTVVIDHINKLDQLTGKPKLLASYLGIGEDQAKSIRTIKAFYGIDVNRDMKPDFVDINNVYNAKDTTQKRVPSFVHVRVSVYDETVLPALRKGLFQYINNNAFIQKLFKEDRRQKEQLITEIDKEIDKIDSLQRFVFRKESTLDKGQLVVLGNQREMKLFYPDMLLLYNRKQKLEKNIRISDEIIVVVQDFTPLEQEERPVLIYIIWFGMSMAVVGLVCAILWQYRKTIWQLIREDATKR